MIDVRIVMFQHGGKSTRDWLNVYFCYANHPPTPTCSHTHTTHAHTHTARRKQQVCMLGIDARPGPLVFELHFGQLILDMRQLSLQSAANRRV